MDHKYVREDGKEEVGKWLDRGGEGKGKEVRKEGRGDGYMYVMQRLKPADLALSIHDCERKSFSMRPERVVRYRITVHSQWSDSGPVVFTDSGLRTHSFRLAADSSVSKVSSTDTNI